SPPSRPPVVPIGVVPSPPHSSSSVRPHPAIDAADATSANEKTNDDQASNRGLKLKATPLPRRRTRFYPDSRYGSRNSPSILNGRPAERAGGRRTTPRDRTKDEGRRMTGTF